MKDVYKRQALSCLMEVNGRGEVVSHRILESVINSDYRMTYTAVREILEDGTPALLEQYAEILPMLEDMEELRQILGEKRRKRGSDVYKRQEGAAGGEKALLYGGIEGNGAEASAWQESGEKSGLRGDVLLR